MVDRGEQFKREEAEFGHTTCIDCKNESLLGVNSYDAYGGRLCRSCFEARKIETPEQEQQRKKREKEMLREFMARNQQKK